MDQWSNVKANPRDFVVSLEDVMTAIKRGTRPRDPHGERITALEEWCSGFDFRLSALEKVARLNPGQSKRTFNIKETKSFIPFGPARPDPRDEELAELRAHVESLEQQILAAELARYVRSGRGSNSQT